MAYDRRCDVLQFIIRWSFLRTHFHDGHFCDTPSLQTSISLRSHDLQSSTSLPLLSISYRLAALECHFVLFLLIFHWYVLVDGSWLNVLLPTALRPFHFEVGRIIFFLDLRTSRRRAHLNIADAFLSPDSVLDSFLFLDGVLGIFILLDSVLDIARLSVIVDFCPVVRT
jgi:hypothetical protein